MPTPGSFVGSGGYVVKDVTPDTIVLEANPRYWAGEPAIKTVNMLQDLGGRSPVDAFVAGDVDVAPISFTDAAWIGYDRVLGPSLRSDPSLSVTYYGFDTRRAPFDNPLVRQAFAQAVDWRRLAKLDELGSSVAATSLVPAGIPGSPEGDFLPPYDPAKARELLAEAGYADGAALGPVSFIASGGGYDGAIIAMLEENLGVKIDYATMDFGTYQDRLATDPPGLWSLSWVADYPGPNDFLGVLLGTGSTANEGGWSNADFDAAVADAGAADEPRGRHGGLRPRAVDRPRPGPRRARLLRHLVVARPRRPAGRDPERDRDPASRGPGMGPVMTVVNARTARRDRPRAALLLIAVLTVPGCRARRSPRRAGRGPDHVRDAARDPDLWRADRVHRRRDVRRAHRAGRAAARVP